MNSRIRNIRAKLRDKNLDGLIVSIPANISYLTKFSSRDAYLLLTHNKNFYFTDFRYTQEAKVLLKQDIKLVKVNGSVFKLIASSCLDLRLKRIGFEERHLAFAEYKQIKRYLAKKAKLAPTHSLIEQLRSIKEPAELEKIKKAIHITGKALDFAKKIIKPGKTEIEIVAELERFLRYQGAAKSAFDIIVASGANSSFPHHLSSNRIIRNNELVLVDIGVDYLGYKSDLTRVFFLGRINSLARKIYDIIREAQNRAISVVKPQQIISKIDKASRQYIKAKGYGGFFGHNLGHGIGLEIHESPQISSRTDEELRPNMVFTIEPAIYLPHKFGIRIEDNVLLTKEGCEVLSGFIHK